MLYYKNTRSYEDLYFLNDFKSETKLLLQFEKLFFNGWMFDK